jgi:hypothetical protein
MSELPPKIFPDPSHSQWLQVGTERMKQQSEDARHRLGIASDLALMGVRTLTFINGGAIVALITLVAPGSPARMATPVDRHLLMWAFGIYAVGVALSLLAITAGYWSQQLIAVFQQESADHTYVVMSGRQMDPPKFSNTPNTLLNVAVILALVSVVCFVGGSALALRAVLPAAG